MIEIRLVHKWGLVRLELYWSKERTDLSHFHSHSQADVSLLILLAKLNNGLLKCLILSKTPERNRMNFLYGICCLSQTAENQPGFLHWTLGSFKDPWILRAHL